MAASSRTALVVHRTAARCLSSSSRVNSASQTGPAVGSASTTPTRKQVTVINDDGRVRWSDLSTREKTARATQQTYNFGMVITGIVMTTGVGYLLYTEVFASDSKTVQFSRAVKRIRADDRFEELLGPLNEIRAFGEPTANRWSRNRPLASSTYKDQQGDHLIMRFNVEGPKGKGVAHIHTVHAGSDFAYRHFYVDINGQRVFLEGEAAPKSGNTIFGIRWR